MIEKERKKEQSPETYEHQFDNFHSERAQESIFATIDCFVGRGHLISGNHDLDCL